MSLNFTTNFISSSGDEPDGHPPDYAAHLRGATVLVTGGAGFIGSHLVEALHAGGARVRVLDDLSTGDRRHVAAARLIVGSVSDACAVREAVSSCSHVFHLAAMVGISQSVHEPEKHHNSNILGTQIVLEECASARVSSVVFTSSSAVYGLNPPIPTKEMEPLHSASPYAEGKALGESMTENYARARGTHAASLRLFNVFGPRQSASGAYAAAIAAFLRAATLRVPATLYGAGEQSRDFVPVANVVQAFVRAADPGRNLRGERFNIGLGQTTTLLKLLDMIGEIAELKLSPRQLPPREADSPRSCADISRAKDALGFRPKVSMLEGLRQTWDWMRSEARTTI